MALQLQLCRALSVAGRPMQPAEESPVKAGQTLSLRSPGSSVPWRREVYPAGVMDSCEVSWDDGIPSNCLLPFYLFCECFGDFVESGMTGLLRDVVCLLL